ncbi:MAG: hypothetical protein R3C16_10510 [Hyphomonadaceae bacterium]
MDVTALRTWGLAVTAMLIAGALIVSRLPEGARADTPGESPEAAFEIAQAAEARAVSMLVRFQGSGPIARAQRRAARGDEASAAREIAAQLIRQRDFAGLCFDRFTAGAAEVVLETCEPVRAGERAATEARWLARLRDMRAVAYADINTTAQASAPG